MSVKGGRRVSEGDKKWEVSHRQGRGTAGKEGARPARPTAGGAAAVRAAGLGGMERGGRERGSAAPNSPAGNSRLQSEPLGKRPGFHTTYFIAPVGLGKLYPKSRVLFWV